MTDDLADRTPQSNSEIERDPWPWVKGLLVGTVIGALPFGTALVVSLV